MMSVVRTLNLYLQIFEAKTIFNFDVYCVG
jgi:hypothetical protein